MGIHEVMDEEKLELGGIYEIEFLDKLDADFWLRLSG